MYVVVYINGPGLRAYIYIYMLYVCIFIYINACKFVQQIPSRQLQLRSANQEFSLISQKPKVRYRVHNSPLPALTTSVNKVMRLIQYNSVRTFKLQIEFVPFKIVPLGGYTPPETLFPLFVATLVVANRNRF